MRKEPPPGAERAIRSLQERECAAFERERIADEREVIAVEREYLAHARELLGRRDRDGY